MNGVLAVLLAIWVLLVEVGNCLVASNIFTVQKLSEVIDGKK